MSETFATPENEEWRRWAGSWRIDRAPNAIQEKEERQKDLADHEAARAHVGAEIATHFATHLQEQKQMQWQRYLDFLANKPLASLFLPVDWQEQYRPWKTGLFRSRRTLKFERDHPLPGSEGAPAQPSMFQDSLDGGTAWERRATAANWRAQMAMQSGHLDTNVDSSAMNIDTNRRKLEPKSQIAKGRKTKWMGPEITVPPVPDTRMTEPMILEEESVAIDYGKQNRVPKRKRCDGYTDLADAYDAQQRKLKFVEVQTSQAAWRNLFTGDAAEAIMYWYGQGWTLQALTLMAKRLRCNRELKADREMEMVKNFIWARVNLTRRLTSDDEDVKRMYVQTSPSQQRRRELNTRSGAYLLRRKELALRHLICSWQRTARNLRHRGFTASWRRSTVGVVLRHLTFLWEQTASSLQREERSKQLGFSNSGVDVLER